MSLVKLVLIGALLGASARAQTNGISPAWDVKSTLKQIADQVATYTNTVQQLPVNEWITKGAPTAYLTQKQSLLNEAGYLKLTSSRLAEQPEKLSLVMDAYFRLIALEGYTASLAEAASRYQAPQVADTLMQLLARNANSASRLRQYMMDLSTTKEQEYAIAEKEAQRCQAQLNHNPLAPPPATARPAKSSKQDKQ
jgi:hypothetical protein